MSTDHTNGLWDTLQEKPDLPLYICAHFSLDFKSKARSCGAHVIEAEPFANITEGIYTTGEIPGGHIESHMPDQALVFRKPKGVAIVTGCAHSGIVRIIEYVGRHVSGPAHTVLGGFHTLDG